MYNVYIKQEKQDPLDRSVVQRRTRETGKPGYIQENQGYIEKNQGYTGEPEIGKNILFIHFVQLKFYPSYAVLTHVL